MTDQKTAIVTGAASGIGAATVKVLAEAGWRVAAFDLNGEAAQRAAASAGPGHVGRALDVADEAAVVAAFAAVKAEFGRLDGLATCAGIADTTPFMDVTVASFRKVYDVNVIGTFLAIREAAKHMMPGGRICTIASIAGLRGGGLSGTAAYASSKGAVLALTKNAARALADRGICVNTVAPGSTLTPMVEAAFSNPAHRARVEAMSVMGRSAEPAEIARSIAYLLSPEASFVNGATLVVDGGLVMY